MEPGPIPWDKRVEYAERAGLDGDMVEAFADILGIMDDAFLAKQREDAKKDMEARTPKTGRRPKRAR